MGGTLKGFWDLASSLEYADAAWPVESAAAGLSSKSDCCLDAGFVLSSDTEFISCLQDKKMTATARAIEITSFI